MCLRHILMFIYFGNWRTIPVSVWLLCVMIWMMIGIVSNCRAAGTNYSPRRLFVAGLYCYCGDRERRLSCGGFARKLDCRGCVTAASALSRLTSPLSKFPPLAVDRGSPFPEPGRGPYTAPCLRADYARSGRNRRPSPAVIITDFAPALPSGSRVGCVLRPGMDRSRKLTLPRRAVCAGSHVIQPSLGLPTLPQAFRAYAQGTKGNERRVGLTSAFLE